MAEIESKRRAMGHNRCEYCGEIVGVYEPTVFVINDDEAQPASQAARPDLAAQAAARYHRDCYDKNATQAAAGL